ncbi:MAG: hypothetical protein ABSE49_34000, partial [Polyangiaceae bacterium]
MEALERRMEDALLERPHPGEVDVPEAPQTGALGPPRVAQGLVDGRLVEVGDVLEGQVDRVDAERGPRPVRARLTRGELVGREDLHHPVPRGEDPPRERREIADLPDAPVALRADGGERNGDAGEARALGHDERTGFFARAQYRRKAEFRPRPLLVDAAARR